MSGANTWNMKPKPQKAERRGRGERQAAGSPLRAGSSPVLLHSFPEDSEGGQTAGDAREQHMCYRGAHPPRSARPQIPGATVFLGGLPAVGFEASWGAFGRLVGVGEGQG